MSADFESKTTFQGLTFKLYRGEGAALLAFDLAQDLATPDFVGFSIEVRYPGATHWGVLHNRLHFDYPPTPERPRTFPSTRRPSRNSAGSTYPVRSCQAFSATASPPATWGLTAR